MQFRQYYGAFGDRVGRQKFHDALGLSRSAGTIEHGHPQRLLRQRLRRAEFHSLIQVVIPVARAVNDISEGAFGCPRGQRHRDLGHIGRGEDRFGTAIIDDIRGLVRREVSVDRRDDETGPKGSPHNFEIPDIVFHEKGDVVARPESLTMK